MTNQAAIGHHSLIRSGQGGSAMIAVIMVLAVLGIMIGIQMTYQKQHLDLARKVDQQGVQLSASQFIKGAISCKNTLQHYSGCSGSSKQAVEFYDSKGKLLLKKSKEGTMQLGHLEVRAACAGKAKTLQIELKTRDGWIPAFPDQNGSFNCTY